MQTRLSAAADCSGQRDIRHSRPLRAIKRLWEESLLFFTHSLPHPPTLTATTMSTDYKFNAWTGQNDDAINGN
ncbi:hypothetical protein, partial [Salmonella sp. 2019-SM259]|uniref:hypothetical protein n=1 Tax=Salmonella sp. 2019-SM259 TaxID=3068194 RepID=UPI00376FE5CC